MVKFVTDHGFKAARELSSRLPRSPAGVVALKSHVLVASVNAPHFSAACVRARAARRRALRGRPPGQAARPVHVQCAQRSVRHQCPAPTPASCLCASPRSPPATVRLPAPAPPPCRLAGEGAPGAAQTRRRQAAGLGPRPLVQRRAAARRGRESPLQQATRWQRPTGRGASPREPGQSCRRDHLSRSLPSNHSPARSLPAWYLWCASPASSCAERTEAAA